VKRASALFRCSGRPDMFAVVHPSTVELGRWQVSYFDAAGAIGDTRRDTLGEALHAVEYGFRFERLSTKET
jgi:hypothetical protein